ncbi:MAG: transketolase [Blastocatellia bacterium]|nr:transketolase [Blastocatellia bacterium]
MSSAKLEQNLDELCVNTIRTLAMDAVQQANSGHPGTAMSMAPVAYVIFDRFLRHNPAHPAWPGRDRFVLSCGHASMLIYSMLHLTGYDLPLDDLKRFRQWDSLTPGHPEYGHTAGVETTTGPLGQGVANTVGFAIAQRWLANRYNKDGFNLFDYNIYAIAGDGCMMEGISNEAASLAGHLGLSNLVWIYDNNHITIEGNTSLSFSDDVATRYMAYGWDVHRVSDANDLEMIERSIRQSVAETNRPSLIIVDSHIAYGAPNKQDTSAAHGEPLGEEEIRLTKQRYGWPPDAKFLVPDEAGEHMRKALDRGAESEAAWNSTFAAYKAEYPGLAAELEHMFAGTLPDGWDADIPVFPPDAKGVAGRDASNKVENAIAGRVPFFIGGSADLAPSTKTLIKDGGSFQADNYGGRNLHYGIREHAMGAAANAIALSKIRTFCAGFLIFSDYMRATIRLAAIMDLPTTFVFTHDSIGVGEDGPTHQPIEHVMSLRMIPSLFVMRPGDANEVAEAWKIAITSTKHPTALILSRQPMPTMDRTKYASAEGVQKGAYVLADAPGGDPEIIFMGTGTELQLCVAAHEQLTSEGVRSRVVSMPCWELFERQSPEYRESVLPNAVRARVACEAGTTLGWREFVGLDGRIVARREFGASAPLSVLLKEFGFTAEAVAQHGRELLGRA